LKGKDFYASIGRGFFDFELGKHRKEWELGMNVWEENISFFG
jgi:hypothetical protein